jgi:hypothetical protein
MNPEQLAEFNALKARMDALEKSSKVFRFVDGKNIQTGRTTGTKIGTAADQKIGFYGKTPIVQQASISGPSGGANIDSEARSVINAILTTLRNPGFIA